MIEIDQGVAATQTFNAGFHIAQLDIINLGSTAGVTLNGVISGTAGVSFENSGTLTINAQNTYSIETDINDSLPQDLFASPPIQWAPRRQSRLVHSERVCWFQDMGQSSSISSRSAQDRTLANSIQIIGGKGMAFSNDLTHDPTPRSLTLTGPIQTLGIPVFLNDLVQGATLTLGSASSPATITRDFLTFDSEPAIAGSRRGRRGD